MEAERAGFCVRMNQTNIKIFLCTLITPLPGSGQRDTSVDELCTACSVIQPRGVRRGTGIVLLDAVPEILWPGPTVGQWIVHTTPASGFCSGSANS